MTSLPSIPGAFPAESSGAVSPTRLTLERHRRVWARKGVLRAVYRSYYREMFDRISAHRPIVEIGSGPGFLKEYAPEIISTDVEPLPWIDRVVDGCVLPFDNGSVGNFVMMDVFHHLGRPFDFLREAHRVLTTGGRVVMIEPWTSPLGRFVYAYLCHEGIDRHADPSNPFGDDKDALDGNAALPQLVFAKKARDVTDSCHFGGLALQSVRPLSAFAYLLTGGFKPICLLPRPLLPLVQWMDRMAAPLAGWIGVRAIIVLEKTTE